MATRRIPMEDRFWRLVDRRSDDECWEWLGTKIPNGYGRVSGFKADATPTKFLAHRVAYELVVGPIPLGLQIDHLCRNRVCVNPAHLEPVTAQENALRSESPPAVNARKTHCPQGHPYDGLNLYVTPQGVRECRACTAAAGRRYRARKREATR